jgi:hypothetical protein
MHVVPITLRETQIGRQRKIGLPPFFNRSSHMSAGRVAPAFTQMTSAAPNSTDPSSH